MIAAVLAQPLLLFPVGPGVWLGLALGGLSVAAALLARSRRSALWTEAPVAVIGATALVGAGVALVPEYAMNRLLSLAACAVAHYAVLAYVASWPDARRVVLGLASLAPIVGVFALISADWSQAAIWPGTSGLYDYFPNLISRMPGSGIPRVSELVSPRHVAGILATLLPLSVGAIGLTRSRAGRAAAAVGTAVALGVIALSQTVLAWAAAALGLLVLLVSGFAARPRRKVVVAGAAAAALIGLALATPLGATIHETLETSIDFSARADAHLDMLRLAALIVRDTPWTGAGLNGFPVAVVCYYPHPPERDIAFYPHAHNVFAQAAADFGVIGAVAMVALFAQALAGCATALQRVEGRGRAADELRIAATAVAAACAAYIAFGLFDAVGIAAKSAPIVWSLLAVGRALPRAGGQPAAVERMRVASRWLTIAFVVLMCGMIAMAILSGSLQDNLSLVACRLDGRCPPTYAGDCPLSAGN